MKSVHTAMIVIAAFVLPAAVSIIGVSVLASTGNALLLYIGIGASILSWVLRVVHQSNQL